MGVGTLRVRYIHALQVMVNVGDDGARFVSQCIRVHHHLQ